MKNVFLLCLALTIGGTAVASSLPSAKVVWTEQDARKLGKLLIGSSVVKACIVFIEGWGLKNVLSQDQDSYGKSKHVKLTLDTTDSYFQLMQAFLDTELRSFYLERLGFDEKKACDSLLATMGSHFFEDLSTPTSIKGPLSLGFLVGKELDDNILKSITRLKKALESNVDSWKKLEEAISKQSIADQPPSKEMQKYLEKTSLPYFIRNFWPVLLLIVAIPAALIGWEEISREKKRKQREERIKAEFLAAMNQTPKTDTPVGA
jgi:hypothetical protein